MSSPPLPPPAAVPTTPPSLHTPLSTPFPGRTISQAKVQSLERRLTQNPNGSEPSADSFQSSVIGFGQAMDDQKNPTPAGGDLTGRIGFDHFTRAGQIFDTPTAAVASSSASPNGALRLPTRSISPTNVAQHHNSTSNVDSQGQTRLIDYNAPPPPSLMEGLNASMNPSAAAAMIGTPVAASAYPHSATTATIAATAASSTPAPPSLNFPLPLTPPTAVFDPTAILGSKETSKEKEKKASHKRKTTASSPSPRGSRKTKAEIAAAAGSKSSEKKKNDTTPVKKPRTDKFAPTSLTATLDNPSGRSKTPPPVLVSTVLSPPQYSNEGANPTQPMQGGSGSGLAQRPRKDITSYFSGSGGIVRQASMVGGTTSGATSTSTSSSSSGGAMTDVGGSDPANMRDEDTDSENEVMIIDQTDAPSAPQTNGSGITAGAMVASILHNNPTTLQSHPGHHHHASSTSSISTSAMNIATPATPTSASTTGKKPRKPRASTATGESKRGSKKKPNTNAGSDLAAAVAASSIPVASISPLSSAGGNISPVDASRIREYEMVLANRERAIREREMQLEQRISNAELTQSKFDEMQKRVDAIQHEYDDYKGKVVALLQVLFKDLCESTQRSTEEKLLRDAVSIGRLVPRIEAGLHLNASVQEEWVDGELFRQARQTMHQLNVEKEELTVQKNKIIAKKKALNRVAKQQTEPSAAAASSSSSSSPFGMPSSMSYNDDDVSMAAAPSQISSSSDETNNGGFKRPASIDAQSLLEQDEMITVRLNHVKLALLEQQAKLSSLELQKKTLVRQTKLHADCRASKFNFHPTLNERYIVLDMLGKGGFSEVYKAYDLVELRYVACKIHQLNSTWTDARKMNYTRHATREYNIHKTLHHPRVVQLYDVFAIDTNSFCTVLEYCDGSDLDMHLKLKHTLGDREARVIITQVFQGLKYLNEQKQKIIHYDLKPGNILFHRGEVKITDFGLSKITPEGSTEGIELTSQGSGTYWYLPPECFSNSPVITSKVDVWSAGVVLYQMLYGRKPFGHGLSADALISSRTMQEARNLEFPKEANAKKDLPLTPTQEFIKACLRYNAHERPEILSIMNDKYFSCKM